ncbi:MAG: methyltransferase domain-containing protein [Longimicrobiales bacterium]|nr:methyltransferase domain-containing protein [Longimicrobiales bacterium]
MKTRRLTPERVDDPGADPRGLEASLAQVSTVNRWLGGDRGLRHALGPLVRSRSVLRILDVGSGDGTSLARLANWAAGSGCAIRGLALDLHSVACRLAEENLRGLPGIHVVQGDALRLPFSSGQFDVAVATLTLHHFGDEGAGRVLRELGRIAGSLVVVSDLQRSWGAYLGARLLAATVWRHNPYTRHDGPVSVQRGFTALELATLGEESGLVDAKVMTQFPFRHTLVARPGEDGHVHP